MVNPAVGTYRQEGNGIGGSDGLSALRVTRICRPTGLSGPRTRPSQARFGSRGRKAVLCAEQFHDQDYEQNKNR